MQSSTLLSYTADLAVDGDKINLSEGHCAMSDWYGARTTEWQVDLGVLQSVHHIIIHFMTGNRVWGTACFN